MDINDKNVEIIFKVLCGENDVTLTDANGVILNVSDSYEDHFAVSKDDVIGKSVSELERDGIFAPSVTAMVLQSKRKQTIIQRNSRDDKIITTGVPIFDDDNNLKYVVSYGAIDIAGVPINDAEYNRLIELIDSYSSQINQLQMKELFKKEIVTTSNSMREISDLISNIANTRANIILYGETGVGKSLLAKKIHQSSNRHNGPFIEINCSTIPESLIESELFGYERGAFTGANGKGKLGKIELADHGTLFLDEIGEISPAMQIKLLNVIQTKTLMRIGSIKAIDVDFRLITATNKNLLEEVNKGNFRKDLYYRLEVIPIHIPPLRERREDIVPLINNFLAINNSEYNKHVSFSSDLYELFQNQEWRGNVREIENVIERIVITSRKDIIDVKDIPYGIIYPNSNEYDDDFSHDSTNYDEMLDNFERSIFIKAYQKYRTSVKVSKALGISQTTASRKLRKYIDEYSDK